jgi:transposase InsO family protein
MAKKTYTLLFRQQFLETWFSTRDETTFSDHCLRFSVSRQTAYDWLCRFDDDGVDGLEAKPSAPGRCPHVTDDRTVALIVEAREEHPTWGPKKLRAWLEQQWPWKVELPAPSTMGDILKRAGLVATRKRRHRIVRHVSPLLHVSAPNDVWTTDFKGHFRTRDRLLCYPLTLADCHSRYLLRCDAYASPDAAVRRSFEAAFIEYGMPSVIRSDNGLPFASSATPAGISRLSVWWLRLGILPERITPGAPWENGRHERMHRTLKAEATEPPQANRKQQQRAFDAFRREFNDDRPHEALGQRPPRTLYTHSKRAYPRKLPEWQYPGTYQLRRITNSGMLQVDGRRLLVSPLLQQQVVGLKQVVEQAWKLYAGRLLLGTVDGTKRDLRLLPADR